MASRVQVEIEGRELSLSNLDKVLYPAAGFRKAEVIDYYRRIGPVMLAHLAGRPPTLVRAPDGPDGERFFEKRCPPHHPDWVTTEAVVAGGGQQGLRHRGDRRRSCGWRTWPRSSCTRTSGRSPIPGTRPRSCSTSTRARRAGVLDCGRVACELRDILGHFDLCAVVKTSGGKGLHLSVPLNTFGATHEETKRFALALGQLLESRDPKRVTVDMAKDKRPGRVFVDWSQNDSHKTTVCAYSLRIRERPTVSTPVTWDEIDDALVADDADALQFETAAVLDRIEAVGDVYADTLTVHQTLPDL